MRLPLFLLGEVLYPGEPLPLHIFEERYREMTSYCISRKQPFGLLCMNESRMATVGCSARIHRVIHKYDDGRMDIMVVGERRFRCMELHKDNLYLTGDIGWIEDSDQSVERLPLERLIAQHMRLLELAGREIHPGLYESAVCVSWIIGRNAGLTLDQRQELLEMNAEKIRIEFLIAHLEQFIPRIERTQALREKITTNGQFKDFPLRDD